MVDMFEWPLAAQKIRRMFFTSLLLVGVSLTLFACNMTYWSSENETLCFCKFTGAQCCRPYFSSTSRSVKLFILMLFRKPMHFTDMEMNGDITNVRKHRYVWGSRSQLVDLYTNRGARSVVPRFIWRTYRSFIVITISYHTRRSLATKLWQAWNSLWAVGRYLFELILQVRAFVWEHHNENTRLWYNGFGIKYILIWNHWYMQQRLVASLYHLGQLTTFFNAATHLWP